MHRLTLPLALALLVAPNGFADPEPGFQRRSLIGSDVNYRLSDGTYLVLDDDLHLYDQNGLFVRTVSSTFGFDSDGGAMLVDPTETFAIVHMLAVGGVYRVELATGATTKLGTAGMADMVLESPDTLLYTIADVISGIMEVNRFQLSDGTSENVIQMQGFVAEADLDAQGNLYVAHAPDTQVAFDTWDILRFTPAQLAAGNLHSSDGTVVFEGRDGLRGFDVVDDGSRIYFTQLGPGGTGEVFHVSPGGAPTFVSDIPYSPVFSGIQYVPGPGPAAFLPYQPAEGGALFLTGRSIPPLVVTGAFEVTPLRPGASVSGPGLSGTGPFDVELANGSPNGFALVYFGPSANVLSPELALQLGGVPVFLGLAPSTLVRAPGVHALDASGAATIPYVNSTGMPGAWAVQLLLADDALAIVGTSTLAFL